MKVNENALVLPPPTARVFGVKGQFSEQKLRHKTPASLQLKFAGRLRAGLQSRDQGC